MSETGLIAHPDGCARCWWAGQDPLYVAYHDTEWGVPERDGRALYEKLILDGFQAGLSWITILRRREGFRAAFSGFDPEVIARYTGEAPPPGTEITVGGKGLGTTGSAADDRGLALVRLDRLADALAAGATPLAGDRPVTFEKPAYATFSMPEAA